MLGVKEFEAYFENVKDVISKYLDKITVPFVKKHVLTMLDNSAFGGKLIRGKIAASTFLETTGESTDSEKAQIGYTIGWAIELIQASYLIADDLMDQSETRRGKKCWYLREGVGDQATNDALLLENLAVYLLETLKSKLPLKVVMDLIKATRDINTVTTMGQTLDYIATQPLYEAYNIIIANKTSHYTIHLPIILGLVASQKFTLDECYSAVEPFSLELGLLFQAQDDYIDVFVDPKVSGKIGTDIQDGKITWIVCKAIELANEEQKKTLKECYGNKEKVEEVKKLFKELHVDEEFKKFEENQSKIVEKELNALDASKYPIKSLQNVFHILSGRKY